MVLGRLINLVVISGIFSKNNEDLDILPPPPPFPDLDKESGEEKEAKRIRKQKQKEIELKRKEEEKRKNQEEKRELAEKQRKKKLGENIRKDNKKKVFDFFHGLGLVKTGKEKEGYRKEKQKWEEQKKLEKGNREEERKKTEKEKRKQKLAAEKKMQQELEKRRKIGEEKQKGVERRKEETELDKELEEIGKIAPRPVKEERVEKAKLEMPKLISLKTGKFKDESAKPEEVVKAEEEIENAINGMKKAKRPSILKGLFKKKKGPVDVGRGIETPEVMPRTYDKIDYIEVIEEKMHKARLALMDFKFEDAKRAYLEVMKAYNELEPKEKSKVYQDIKDLYYERKSAEKFMK